MQLKRSYFILTLFLTLLLVGFADDLSFSGKGATQIIILMFIGGFLTAFTPCVYPLIPVTIGIISEINKEQRRSSLLLSLIYSSGIILTYTLLGVFAGLGSLTFGNYMGNPVFVWILALIFFLLGLSMTGFYEIKLPDFIAKRILNIKGSGVVSIFSMGLVAGFVAAPCTGPVLASALIYISTGGSPLLGGIYLFFYATGLSVIFIISGTFSTLLKRLPRSGRWMIIIRSVFAVAIMTYGIYLLNSIYNFAGKLGLILSIILIGLGIAAGGLTREADFMPVKIKLLKLSAVLLISLGLIGLLSGQEEKIDNIKWIKDYEEGMRLSEELKRPVIIDFYANWCAACKEIRAKTFTDGRIQKESERFVMIMIDATNPDEKITDLEKRYRVSGLPTIIFLNSEQKEVQHLRVTGFIGAADFLNRMRNTK